MSTKITVTGMIAEPALRYTPQNKAVLEVRINATASQRSKQTNQWEDIGSPLWVGVTFWEDEATHLANILSKGSRVTVEGVLVNETFEKRDGGEGSKLVVRFPKFLGVIPKQPRGGSQQANTASFTTPTDDPWGNNPQTPQNGSYDQTAPF